MDQERIDQVLDVATVWKSVVWMSETVPELISEDVSGTWPYPPFTHPNKFDWLSASQARLSYTPFWVACETIVWLAICPSASLQGLINIYGWSFCRYSLITLYSIRATIISGTSMLWKQSFDF